MLGLNVGYNLSGMRSVRQRLGLIYTMFIMVQPWVDLRIEVTVWKEGPVGFIELRYRVYAGLVCVERLNVAHDVSGSGQDMSWLKSVGWDQCKQG